MSSSTIATTETISGTIVATNTSDAALRDSAWESVITSADGSPERTAALAYAASLADLDAEAALARAVLDLTDKAGAWSYTARMVATMEASGMTHKAIAQAIDPTLTAADLDRTNTTLWKRIGRYANGGRLVIAAPESTTERLLAFRTFGNHETKALSSGAAEKLRKSPNLDLDRFAAADRAARDQAKRDKAAAANGAADASTGAADAPADTNGAAGTDDAAATRQGPRSAAGEPNVANPANGATTTAGDKAAMPVITLDMLAGLTDSSWSALVVTVLGSADDKRRAHLTEGQRVNVVKSLGKVLTAFGEDAAKRDAAREDKASKGSK